MKQSTALAILKTGKNVFLTGSAGAGKTHTLKQYIHYLRARKVPVAITASTGIAATHMSGITIHSWSGIGIKSELSEKDLIKLSKRKSLKERIEDTSVLIIDEISMLHAKQLNAVNQVLQHIRNSDKPFGGMQVVLAGDFFQLPPIGEKGETNRDKFAFMSSAWLNADLQICYLSEQYRQQETTVNNELTLNDILNQIRSANVTYQAIQTLENTIHNELNVNRTRLYTHNFSVDKINQNELQTLTSTAKTYLGESMGDKKLCEMLQKNVRTSDELTLKIGAKVMFIKNISDLNVFNGTMGEVIGFYKMPIEQEDSTIPTEEMEFPVVRLNTGREVIATHEEWSVEDEQGEILASYRQIPLCLAWAITVHKSQGMTLDYAEIDLSRTFEMGQGYVALSRLKDLAGLKLLGLNNDSLRLDPLARGADKRFIALSDELQEKYDNFTIDELTKNHHEFVLKSGGTLSQKVIDDYEKYHKKKKLKALKKQNKKSAEGNNKSTLEKTKELVLKGLSIIEISNERDLAQSTIMNHLLRLKRQGDDLDYERFRPTEQIINDVTTAYEHIHLEKDPEDFDQKGNIKLGAIHRYLDKKVTWHNIRLALIFVEKNYNE